MNFIDFYDLEWHDAAILKIVVDRSYPESHNQIRLDVQWPDSDNTFSSIYFGLTCKVPCLSYPKIL